MVHVALGAVPPWLRVVRAATAAGFFASAGRGGPTYLLEQRAGTDDLLGRGRRQRQQRRLRRRVVLYGPRGLWPRGQRALRGLAHVLEAPLVGGLGSGPTGGGLSGARTVAVCACGACPVWARHLLRAACQSSTCLRCPRCTHKVVFNVSTSSYIITRLSFAPACDAIAHAPLTMHVPPTAFCVFLACTFIKPRERKSGTEQRTRCKTYPLREPCREQCESAIGLAGSAARRSADRGLSADIRCRELQ